MFLDMEQPQKLCTKYIFQLDGVEIVRCEGCYLDHQDRCQVNSSFTAQQNREVPNFWDCDPCVAACMHAKGSKHR